MLISSYAGLRAMSQGNQALNSGIRLSDITEQAIMYATKYNSAEIVIRLIVVFMTEIQPAIVKEPVSGSFFGSVSQLKASVPRISRSKTFVRNLLDQKL